MAVSRRPPARLPVARSRLAGSSEGVRTLPGRGDWVMSPGQAASDAHCLRPSHSVDPVPLGGHRSTRAWPKGSLGGVQGPSSTEGALGTVRFSPQESRPGAGVCAPKHKEKRGAGTVQDRTLHMCYKKGCTCILTKWMTQHMPKSPTETRRREIVCECECYSVPITTWAGKSNSFH